MKIFLCKQRFNDRDYTDWNDFFLWIPRIIDSAGGNKYWAWLMVVERKNVRGHTTVFNLRFKSEQFPNYHTQPDSKFTGGLRVDHLLFTNPKDADIRPESAQSHIPPLNLDVDINIEQLVAPKMPSEQFPQFLQRTAVNYVTTPIADLKQRGLLDNRMFDSIVGYLPQGAYVAVGFMTSLMTGEQTAQDVDLFFTSEQALWDTMTLLFDEDEGDPEAWFWRQYNTEQNRQLFNDLKEAPSKIVPMRFIKFEHKDGKLPLQLIKIAYYADATHVIDSFDLTIAQFAADSNNVYANPLSYYDVVNKRIVLHRMQFPSSTMRRVIKYASKGFYACPGSLANIATQIQQFVGQDDPLLNSVVYVD